MEDCIFVDDRHIISLEYIFYQTEKSGGYQVLEEENDHNDTGHSCDHNHSLDNS